MISLCPGAEEVRGTGTCGQRDLATLNGATAEELSAIAGKLVGYKFLAAYGVPRTDRRDLLSPTRSPR